MVWSSLALIITFFYTDVFRSNLAHLAMLGLLPRLIDAFADVAMGMYTDSHTTRWGRYRPYFLVFAIPFGVSVMLVFTTPELSYNGKLIWAYATYILMMLVFTAVTIPDIFTAWRVDGSIHRNAFRPMATACFLPKARR